MFLPYIDKANTIIRNGKMKAPIADDSKGQKSFDDDPWKNKRRLNQIANLKVAIVSPDTTFST